MRLVIQNIDTSQFFPPQALGEAAGDAIEARGGAAAASTKGAPIDIGLILYFVFWYVGNYYVSSPPTWSS